MTAFEVLSGAAFLIVAGGIGLWFQFRGLDVALEEAFEEGWGFPDPALTEDAEIEWLYDLWPDAPSFPKEPA